MEETMLKNLVIILVILIIAMNFTTFNTSLAQTLTCEVSVTINQTIPLERREKLNEFKSVVEDYINNYKWTDEEIDVNIETTMQIFFNSASASMRVIFSEATRVSPT